MPDFSINSFGSAMDALRGGQFGQNQFTQQNQALPPVPAPGGAPMPVDPGIGGPAPGQGFHGMFGGSFGGDSQHRGINLGGHYGGLMSLVNSLNGQLPTLPEGWTPYPTENTRSAWRDWVQSIRSMPGYEGGKHPLAYLINGGGAAPAPGMVPGVPGSVSTMPVPGAVPAQGIAVGEPNPAAGVGTGLGVLGAVPAASATTLPTY